MSSNRSAILTKTHRVLNKHFTPEIHNAKLPVLEQLIFACCLEDSSAVDAMRAFAALEEQFFDWNEVRVSTVTELAEAMPMLSAPREAATRVKKVLQSVFESAYSFDLEQFKKENLGAAVKKIQKYEGATPFVVAYVTQNALGGHAIPIGRGALESMYIVGVINEKEKAAYKVPGLERAIPKSKGVEFGSLINQLGAQLWRKPHATGVRKILLEITPAAKDRFRKRGAKKEAAKPKAGKAKKKAAATKKLPAKKTATTKKVAPAKKAGAVAKAKPIKKKVVVKKKKVAGKKKTTAPQIKKKKKKAIPKKKKTATKRISRRKPR